MRRHRGNRLRYRRDILRTRGWGLLRLCRCLACGDFSLERITHLFVVGLVLRLGWISERLFSALQVILQLSDGDSGIVDRFALVMAIVRQVQRLFRLVLSLNAFRHILNILRENIAGGGHGQNRIHQTALLRHLEDRIGDISRIHSDLRDGLPFVLVLESPIGWINRVVFLRTHRRFPRILFFFG